MAAPNRTDIMNKANEQEFTILLRTPSKRTIKGKIAGSKLDFPMCYNNAECVQFEISWNMVERIARGEVKQVIA